MGCKSSCEGTGMTNVFAMGHVGACWILFMWSAAVQLVVLCGVQQTQAGVIPVHIYGSGSSSNGSEEEAGREGLSLYTPPPLVLDYHDGPLMTSSTGIPVYLLWYGVFSKSEKQTVADFVRSISPMNEQQQQLGLTPSVSMWWKTLTSYKDNRGMQVTSVVSIAGQHTDRSGSLGRNLNLLDVETLVENSVANEYFPADAAAVYVVVTAYNVNVQGFCLSSCGLHSFLQPSAKTKGKQLVYVWVGNPGTQCPGYCAWPFAVDPSIGPQDFKPLIAPNGGGCGWNGHQSCYSSCRNCYQSIQHWILSRCCHLAQWSSHCLSWKLWNWILPRPTWAASHQHAYQSQLQCLWNSPSPVSVASFVGSNYSDL